MVMRASWMLGVSMLLIGGCASTGQGRSAADQPSATPVLDELPPQDLARGQCALVLWAQRGTPTRIVMTLSQPAVARIRLSGRLMDLARVSQNGEAVHGQFPSQAYRGEGVSLSLSFTAENASPLTGGAVVPSAVVELVDGNGWTSVIPAAGIIACQA
jgi:hypothetical protein